MVGFLERSSWIAAQRAAPLRGSSAGQADGSPFLYEATQRQVPRHRRARTPPPHLLLLAPPAPPRALTPLARIPTASSLCATTVLLCSAKDNAADPRSWRPRGELMCSMYEHSKQVHAVHTVHSYTVLVLTHSCTQTQLAMSCPLHLPALL